jgi:pimeloyl-ACP methyl ester carboxylesterase
MSKSAFIVPGWGEKASTVKKYGQVGRMFVKKDYGVEYVDLTWSRKTMTQWVAELTELAKGKSDTDISLLGFSLGGMASFIASSKVEVENLILCSPSGFFREYMSIIPREDMAWMGKRRREDFNNLSWRNALETSRVANGYILIGEKELEMWPDFKLWVSELEQATGWRLIVVPEADHDIALLAYQEAIMKVVKGL